MFYALYIVFFISAIFYGTLYIGFITPRQLMAILMFGYLLINGKLFFDKYMKIYAIFVFFYFLSNFLDGYIVETIKFIFAFFFVAYVGYVATTYLFRTKRGDSVFFYTIILLGCLNSIVTIGQLLHFEPVTILINSLHLNEGYDAMTAKHSNYSIAGEDEFVFALPGLFQDPVTNGYFSSVAAICSMYIPYRWPKFISFFPWLLLMLGCFATQQRTSLGTAVMCSAVAYYYIIKYMNKNRIVPILFLAIIITFLTTYSFDIETRFDDMLNMDSRNKIYDVSLNFISDNLFLGGINSFFEKYNVYPHNLISNALIVGGLFGAIPIFIILFKQIKLSFFIMYHSKYNINLILLVLCLFSMLGSSLMHNQSIVYGDFLYWCFAAFLISYRSLLSNEYNCRT